MTTTETPKAPETPVTTPSEGATTDPKPTEQTNLLEQPTEGEKKPTDTAAKDTEVDGEKPPQAAPERFELTLPEGATFDQDTLAAFTDVANQNGLTKESAQKVLEAMAPRLIEQTTRQAKAYDEQMLAATKADKEIGGDKLKETVALANKALSLAPPGLRKLLAPLSEGGTGLGNSAEFLRWASAIGKALSEDKFVAGSPPTSTKSFAEQLYPSMAKKA